MQKKRTRADPLGLTRALELCNVRRATGGCRRWHYSIGNRNAASEPGKVPPWPIWTMMYC